MAAWEEGSSALATGTGTQTATHGVTGLPADPAAGNWTAALLAGTTAAAGITITDVGSTTITFSKSATNAGTAFWQIGLGVNASGAV